jgi:predicted RNA-binding Zn-ribbon protein involved in translation (DUF1610 family)
MAEEFRFRCPSCGATVVVDRPVRDAMLAEGCVVCAARVSPNCFEAE